MDACQIIGFPFNTADQFPNSLFGGLIAQVVKKEFLEFFLTFLPGNFVVLIGRDLANFVVTDFNHLIH